MNILVKAFPLLVALSLANAAQAAYLHIAQPAGAGSGIISSRLNNLLETPGHTAADRFLLDQSAAVSSVYWWGYLRTGAVDFRIDWYRDLDGAPGSLLSSSEGALWVTEVPGYGNSPLGELFKYALQLDNPFPVDAGETYWISIFNQAENSSWLWSMSGFPQTAGAVGRRDGVETWSNPLASQGFSARLAFALSAEDVVVPLPPALALFMSPMAALAGAHLIGKRRRAMR